MSRSLVRMGTPPKEKMDTLRPPAPGREESISIPVRGRRPDRSSPPSAPPRRAPSSEPPAATFAREPVPSPPRLPREAMPERPSSRPPKGDPRSDGGGVFAEIVRGAKLDARESSIPDPLPPDRRQRVLQIVSELARCGPESDAPLRKQLLKLGTDALPAVAHAFPGSLWVDLGRPHRPLKSARHLSGLANTLIAYGDDAVPYVASLLRATRPETRLSAALVATDLVHGELVKPLAARLQDDVPLVRQAAMGALRASALLPEARRLRAELIGTVEDTQLKAQWRKKAAWMIGQLRDAEAVPRLIELLGDDDVSEVCRETLVLLVGRDVGRFRFRWRSWYKSHGEEGRARWLIAALDQPDQERRAVVAEELVLLTGEGFDRRHAIATREQAKELGQHYERWLASQR
ncbi:MAG: hypothetical protein H6719_22995 [Sandaracinaceae bacterium]|nr:hypothetical protein [Sandaracinaceae bacterium]